MARKAKKAGNKLPVPSGPELEKVTKWALLGATDADIATFLDVSPSTVKRWKAGDESFKAALRRGGREANAEAAYGLLRRAMGMTIVEEKAVVVDKHLEIVELKRELPPDTAAASKWLHNRERETWGDNAGAGRFDALLDLMAMLKEYARRHGEAAAMAVAEHHGYAGALLEGESAPVDDDTA